MRALAAIFTLPASLALLLLPAHVTGDALDDKVKADGGDEDFREHIAAAEESADERRHEADDRGRQCAPRRRCASAAAVAVNFLDPAFVGFIPSFFYCFCVCCLFISYYCFNVFSCMHHQPRQIPSK